MSVAGSFVGVTDRESADFATAYAFCRASIKRGLCRHAVSGVCVSVRPSVTFVTYLENDFTIG